MICLFFKRYSRCAGLLLTACFSMALLVGAGAVAGDNSATRERFIELDSEIQSIKEELLELNQEMLLLEESSLHPRGPQLVVLVSIANNSTIHPEHVTLLLDGQSLSQHDYSALEGAALRQGGVHRLHAGKLSEGEHTLDISLSGRLGGDEAFERQHSATITKAPGRKIVELQFAVGKKHSNPEVIVREWQQ